MSYIITECIPMRDGVKLFTKVFLPENDKKYNVVLCRTPYSSSVIPLLEALSNGGICAVVEQDVRGSGSSEGEIYPWLQELNDGEDCLKWIVQQPWFDKRIAMTGGSYVGLVQWFAASSGLDELIAIEPAVAPCNYFDSPNYRGGQLVLQQNIQWGFGRKIANHPEKFSDIEINDDLSWHLPLDDIDRKAGVGTVDYWQDWLKHPSYDDYWKKLDLSSFVGKIKAPAFIDSGWFDIYTQGALDSCSMMVEKAGSKNARNFTKCIIGPWAHPDDFGELPVEGDVSRTSNLVPLRQKFLTGLLANPDIDPLPEIARFTYFMFGSNSWRQSEVWPPTDAQEKVFYLNSNGTANTLYGDGILSTAPPNDKSEPDVFISDPHNPVPTGGGHFICAINGSHDQTEIEKRPDVLVYTSSPLEDDLEIAGRVKVILHAASTAYDCDFTAKLVDVFPDGRAFNLADGIIRAAHRISMSSWELLVPGIVYEYEIDLWSIANRFLKEHCIRLEIAGSNFPQMARNNQTGKRAASDTRLRIARQTVFHDSLYPSRIVLPVLANS